VSEASRGREIWTRGMARAKLRACVVHVTVEQSSPGRRPFIRLSRSQAQLALSGVDAQKLTG